MRFGREYLSFEESIARKGGGTNTNTVTTGNQPPANFQSAYNQLLGQVQGIGSTPYQPYSGNLQAPLSPDQLAGIQGVQGAQGTAAPYLNSAAQYINSATTPIWPGVQQFSPGAANQYASDYWGNAQQFSPGTVNQYMSPYVGDVVHATEAQFANTNAQQREALTGNAIKSGGWGGDRADVAQGILAGQQATAQAPVIAGLYNQGYGQALGEFNNQQAAEIAARQATHTQALGEFNTQQAAQLGANEANAWLNSQAGYGMASLGNEAQNTSLTGANALLGVGGLEQGQAQGSLNIPYQQYIAAQAYPFQTAGWLQGLETNLGSSAGGTGTTSYPGASPISQVAGLGAGALGIAGATGGFGSNGWLTNLFNGSGSSGSSNPYAIDPSTGNFFGAGGFTTGQNATLNPWYGSLAARGGGIPHRAHGGNVVAFPRRAPGGLVPSNDNGWWPQLQRRAAGGGLVTLIPGAYAGSPMVPQLLPPAATSGGDPVSSYLTSVAAGASHALPMLAGLPAPAPAPAAAAPPAPSGGTPIGTPGMGGSGPEGAGNAGQGGPEGGSGANVAAGGGSGGDTSNGFADPGYQGGGISSKGWADLASLAAGVATGPIGAGIAAAKGGYDLLTGAFTDPGNTPSDVSGAGFGGSSGSVDLHDTSEFGSGPGDISAGDTGTGNARGGIVARAPGGDVPTVWEPQGNSVWEIPPPSQDFDVPLETRGLVDPNALPAHEPTERNEPTAGGLAPSVRAIGSAVPVHGPARGGMSRGPISLPGGFVPPVPPAEQPATQVPAAGADHGAGQSDGIEVPPAHASPWLALAEAGFGAAAGRSPHALENIGAGAQRGVQQWISADHVAQQLSAQAAEAKARLADTAAYREGVLANASNRTDVMRERVQDQLSLGQLKASQAIAIAAMHMGAHATEGDQQAAAAAELMRTVNPDTGQNYTRPEAYEELHGFNIRRQNTEIAGRRADQGDDRIALARETADLNAADKALTLQAGANSRDVAGARAIMNANPTATYAKALEQARASNQSLPSTVPAGRVPAAAASPAGGLPAPKNKQEYDALPSGTTYMAPDNKPYMKP